MRTANVVERYRIRPRTAERRLGTERLTVVADWRLRRIARAEGVERLDTQREGAPGLSETRDRLRSRLLRGRADQMAEQLVGRLLSLPVAL